MPIAKGTFEVKLNPLEPYNKDENAMIGRMSIDKIFKGDLEGTSKGEMVSAFTEIKNSAGYAAIERVKCSLNGKKGEFTLQHLGTMNRGEGSLTIYVVPDSGSDELKGISGKMKIIIEGKQHYYELDYQIKKPE